MGVTAILLPVRHPRWTLFLAGPKLQADQSAFGVAEVPYDFSDRGRQLAYQRGNGKDLIGSREIRVLDQIDDFNVVTSCQMLFAQVLEIGKGHDGARGLSGDVKP